ncbi:MAG: hypothetical protein WDW36_008702 [Sanguina aurantia]
MTTQQQWTAWSIYASEFRPHDPPTTAASGPSSAPAPCPKFTIRMCDPGDPSHPHDDATPTPTPNRLPSTLFSLSFTLPPGYPSAGTAPPIQISGPLGTNDPRRHALMQHVQATAAAELGESAGGSGCVYQVGSGRSRVDCRGFSRGGWVTEAARAWIDANLPSDIGARRDSAQPGSQSPGAPADPRTADTRPADTRPAAAAAAAAVPGEAPAPVRPHWYQNEEADVVLMRRAVGEAAERAGHRAAPAQPAPTPAKGAAAAAAGAATPAPPQVPVMDECMWSAHGRWDYVVGLVGKPSAGKSTFFNACVDPATDTTRPAVQASPSPPSRPTSAERSLQSPTRHWPSGWSRGPAGGYRGFKPLQLRSMTESVATECVAAAPRVDRPAHGFAPSFTLSSLSPAYNNIEPLTRWAAATGWDSALRWRRVPVVLKDVAGLVPGAYQGRGRGNAFLNDLCDADVLIHVVDASGSSDKEGQLLKEGEGADPLEDIGWVREEIHRWVFNNIRSKWASVLHKPARLAGLFSGYHTARAMVEEVLRRVGIDPAGLSAEGARSPVSHWGEWEVHRLVAAFLQARFPILLALNKADMSTSADHIKRVRAALPLEPVLAVSAESESWLCKQRRAAWVQYDSGAAAAVVTPAAGSSAGGGGVSEGRRALPPAGGLQRLQQIQETVLDRYGSSGALAALTCAVSLRPPLIVFPVDSLNTCASLPARPGGGSGSGGGGTAPAPKSGSSGARVNTGLLGSGLDAKARAAEGGSTSVLRDAILMRPGSTSEDLFAVLKKPPYGMLEGDFVRAECRTISTPTSGTSRTPAAVPVQSPTPRVAANGAGDISASHGEESSDGSGAPAGISAGHSRGEAGATPPQGGGSGVQSWRMVKKEEVLSFKSCVIKVMTNRKSRWQHAHNQTAAAT